MSLHDAIIRTVKKGTDRWAKQRKAEERHAAAARLRRERLTKSRPVTIKEAAWEVMERAYLAASGNDTLPALATQIMYAARNEIQERTGKQLDRQYFNQTLLPDYIEEHSVDWDVVYDERGHFTEPHTGLSFGLGTLAVRDYVSSIREPELIESSVAPARVVTHGPRGRYGFAFFIEKEGFFPLFEAVRLAERYDLALMSTKGLSVTACRRLVEELSRRGVTLLVLHNFDKSALSILSTLQRNTRRYRFHNRPNVIDLGLRLDDLDEGLLTRAENVFDRGSESKREENLRLNGATDEEIEFLLHQRVELNALSSDQLVAFVERKLKQIGVKKIVPEQEMLVNAYRLFSRSHEAEQIVQRELEKLNAGARVTVPTDLDGQVRKYLDQHPEACWDDAIRAALDETQLDHVREKKQEAKEKSGDFTDDSSDEEGEE
jgi:hypothetical protein